MTIWDWPKKTDSNCPRSKTLKFWTNKKSISSRLAWLTEICAWTKKRCTFWSYQKTSSYRSSKSWKIVTSNSKKPLFSPPNNSKLLMNKIYNNRKNRRLKREDKVSIKEAAPCRSKLVNNNNHRTCMKISPRNTRKLVIHKYSKKWCLNSSSISSRCNKRRKIGLICRVFSNQTLVRKSWANWSPKVALLIIWVRKLPSKLTPNWQNWL